MQPIISTIVSEVIPPMIMMSASIAGATIDEEETVEIYSIIIELFNLIRGIGFVVWYFYCNHLVKQRKVTVMQKVKKLFVPLIGLYFLLFFIEIVIAVVEI